MKVKLKRLNPKVYEIIDCENITYVGRKICVDYDKNCFNGILNLSRYYDLDTAGNVFTMDGRRIGCWEMI